MLNNPATISVVLPTHNRGNLLRETLRALVAQSLPKSAYEIIVVNNRSTDCTREILQEFADTHGIKHIDEEKLGAAIARNTGWRAAQGSWVAFMDDDVLVPPTWLESIRSAVESSSDKLACVGGPVRPILQGSQPSWMHDELNWPLAIIDWGDHRKEMQDIFTEWLVSANLAVSRDVLEELGGFHPGLDKVGRRNLVNGETHLQKRILDAGYRCVYDPHVCVRHHVTATRLTQSWFIDRYYHQGLSDFAVDLIETRFGLWHRFVLALGMTFRVLGSRGNLSRLLKSTEDPEEFREKCYLIVKFGYVAGLVGALKR
jgi:glycosyltransferase involved in cell wall biosynthesis